MACVGAVLAGGVGGCAGAGGPASTDRPTPREPAGRGATLAYVGADAVRLGELRSGLLATGGGAVLGERIIDAEVERRLAAAGRSVGPAEVAAERERLMATLADDADTAARLMRDLRAARGLTDDRLAALLRRNAGLRALVADEVTVTEESVRLAYERQYGPRRVVRVAVLPTAGQAERFARDVRGGASFSELAIERSIDGSAGAGGLIAPIGRGSEAVPAGVRQAAWSTPVGGLSDRLAVPEGYALLRVERELPASATALPAVREGLTRQVRREQEAAEMRRLAASILRGAKVTVLDPELAASWTRYLEANAPAR